MADLVTVAMTLAIVPQKKHVQLTMLDSTLSSSQVILASSQNQPLNNYLDNPMKKRFSNSQNSMLGNGCTFHPIKTQF